MINIPRLAAGLLVGLGVLSPNAGWAQAETYPNRAIKIIVPYTPGGTVDVLARALGQRLTDAWGQAVVIENRPGAGGNLGTEMAAKSPADGYTLLMATNSPLTTNLALYKSVRYDTLRDFDGVTLFAETAVFFVTHPSSPTRSVAEVIELAKKEPKGISIASSGFGTLGHFLTSSLSSVANNKITHVPYRGGAPAVTAVMAGEIPYAIVDTGAATPLLNDKRVLGLAVSGTRPSVRFPDIPPFANTKMPNGSMTAWIPAMAPKGTPKPILEKLNGEIQKIMKDPAFRESMLKLGLVPIEGVGTDKLDEFVRQEVPRWKEIVANSGLEMK